MAYRPGRPPQDHRLGHNAPMSKKSNSPTETTQSRRHDGAAMMSEVLRARPGFRLADLDPHSTPGFGGDNAAGEEQLERHATRVSDLQERLYAESKGGGKRSILLVIQ